jgi:dTDP-3-amino-3,4,6-trideoxy-alpha-D-glucopyranose N,N-dimethyltransferase
MGDYSKAAEFYDLLYSGDKDYSGEAQMVAELIGKHSAGASTVLDVGCGTGSHARGLIDLGFFVDGVDIESAFVEIASEKCPEGTFRVADMTMMDLPERYDAVVCLFSAIGYVLSESALNQTLCHMVSHLSTGGVVIVDPWFEPEQLSDRWIATRTSERDGTTVTRMSRNVIEGSISRLEFEYLIGTPEGIEHRSETHDLGLFTQGQMESAFGQAGLAVERLPKMLRTRGVYVGTRMK